jgi:hypothetical protein
MEWVAARRISTVLTPNTLEQTPSPNCPQGQPVTAGQMSKNRVIDAGEMTFVACQLSVSVKKLPFCEQI